MLETLSAYKILLQVAFKQITKSKQTIKNNTVNP